MPHLMREQSEAIAPDERAIRGHQTRAEATGREESQSEAIGGNRRQSVSPSRPLLMVTAHELASSTPMLMVTSHELTSSTPLLMVTAHELASSTPLLMVTASVLWGKARRTRTLPSTLL